MVDDKDTSAPLISTLIPTYRRPKLLERAIRSALNQTYPHLQVWVYDNASGDETEATVRRLAEADPRVRYFCHPENVGVYRNFIHAMAHVETPYFSIVSDDDVLLPGLYETAMAGFREHPESIMSVSTTILMDDAGRVVGAPILDWEPGFYKPPEGLIAMLDKIHPDWAGIVFRREVMAEVGEADIETRPHFDLDFELRIAGRCAMTVSRDPGAIFVLHPNSVSGTSGLTERHAGWLKLIRNLTQDEHIPLAAREHARAVLTERTRRSLFLAHGLGAIARKRWQDNREAAHLLRVGYDRPLKAALLRLTGWCCENLPFAHPAFTGLSAIQRSLGSRKRMRGPLQQKYGDYAVYLGIEAPVRNNPR